MQEQWKPIEGYEGLYEVSNMGNVKSLERFDSRGYHRKEIVLNPQKDGKGYFFVILYKNGVGKPFKINRLVWQTFVGEIPPKWDINHLDENKENNKLENLEACSHKKNCNWATRNARSAAAKSKPVEAIDKVTGRVVYVFSSAKEAARNGFCRVAVGACCRNCYSTHKGNVYKGFIWRFKEN